MPKAQENEGSTEEPWDLSGNRDFLEYGQRHGILEVERYVSGGKRICFCYGFLQKYCFILFHICLYIIVLLLGLHLGLNSCPLNGSI
tara:strand:+ start:1571 stop:1831 length:261 start_codon:yes stop_codon:yes gene_type:complete